MPVIVRPIPIPTEPQESDNLKEQNGDEQSE